MNRIKETLNFIGQKLKRSVQRFPLTLGITMTFVVCAIALAHADYNAAYREDLERVLFALAIGIPMTAAVKLFIERLALTGIKMLVSQGAALVLTLIYYVTIPEDFNAYFGMRFAALWAILFLAFLVVPYFYKREGLSRYILHLLGRFFLTALYAGVIYGGIAMMIFTIDQLFNVTWPDEIYFDVFIIIAGAFGVTHFLGSVPESKTDLEVSEYSKIFKSLFLFIVLPIVSVYTVILYAYFIKILFNFKLPDGIIGNLVLWYATVSVGALFFVRDLRGEVSWLGKFYKIYIPLMTIPLAMLFIAIGIRIDAYGMTMPRYFVVALALFSTFSLAVMWFKKNDTSVVTMILLVTFITLSFFGIFSGYNLSLKDQLNRLEVLLESNQMLDANGALIANSNVPNDQQDLISEKIDFLFRSYEPEELPILPEGFIPSEAKQYLGFDMKYYWGGDSKDVYFNYYTKGYGGVMALAGADYLISTNHYDQLDAVELGQSYKVDKSLDSGIVQIYRDKEMVFEIDLSTAAATFYLNQDENVVVTSPDGKMKATLDFISIDGRITSEEPAKVPSDLSVQSFEVRILLDVE